MSMDHDVIIAGGGLNGPALALALAGAGLSVAVIDARPAAARAAASFDGRAYALALASRRLLAGLGLWAGLAPNAQPILKVAAAQGEAGEGPGLFRLLFDSAEIEEGPVGHMIEDRFLYAALLAAMAGRVTHLPGRRVVGQRAAPGHAAVTLDDGSSLAARLLVGADGRGSGVAARAGIARRGAHDEVNAPAREMSTCSSRGPTLTRSRVWAWPAPSARSCASRASQPSQVV